MGNSNFCCGFECGLTGTGTHWTTGGSTPANSTIQTTTKRTLNRAGRVNNGTSTTSYFITPALNNSSGWAIRFYLYIATAPSNGSFIFRSAGTDSCGVRYNAGQLRAYTAAGEAASGPSVSTGQWYRVDVKINISANPHTVDIQVDGTAGTQATNAVAGALTSQFWYGFANNVTLGDIYFDDIIHTFQHTDYPLGSGKVEAFVPTSDGTHSGLTAGEFKKGTAGADIVNATTDAYTMVDDVPVKSAITTSDLIAMILPSAAADYVELKFGPAPGVGTPTEGPRGVEILCAIHQAATGAGNMELQIVDNGTASAFYTASAVAGVISLAYKRFHYGDPPSAASNWTVSGNGNFNDVRLRFRSGATVDANPDQYLDSAMIEAEFATTSNITTTKTQLGKINVRNITLKTQSGKLRVRQTLLKTQLGIIRVRKTVLQTQLGKIDVRNTTTKTQLGKVDIRNTTLKTTTGVSRIRKTILQTIQGLLRIRKTVLQTQTGKINVRNTVTRTQLGKIDIRNTTLRTIQGVIKIVQRVLKTTTGVVRIRKIILQTQLGIIRIKKTVLQTTTGIIRVRKTVLQTQTGRLRISKTVSSNQLGKINIRNTILKTLDGKIRIRRTILQTSTGIIRIRRTVSQTVLGKIRIYNTVLRTITGVLRIRKTVSQTVLGKTRIQQTVLQTTTGKLRIKKTTQQNQLGMIRIFNVVQHQIQGRLKIVGASQQIQLGIINIRNTTQRNIQGVIRINANEFYLYDPLTSNNLNNGGLQSNGSISNPLISMNLSSSLLSNNIDDGMLLTSNVDNGSLLTNNNQDGSLFSKYDQ